jgi:hypothetical protein
MSPATFWGDHALLLMQKRGGAKTACGRFLDRARGECLTS